MRNDLRLMDSEAKVKDALFCWEEWMKADNSDTGFPQKSSVFASGGMKLWQELEDSMDKTMALAVNAIMEGMPCNQVNAIHHFHLSEVYKPQRTLIEDDYSDALLSVEIGLRRRDLL